MSTSFLFDDNLILISFILKFNVDFLIVHIIGWLAALFSMMAFVPQTIKTIKTKKTSGISLWMYLIYNFANFCWIIWASINLVIDKENIISDLTIIVPNIICILISGIIVGIKVYNIKKHGETF